MSIQVKLSGLHEFIAVMQHAADALKPETARIVEEAMRKCVEESRNEADGRGWKLADQIMLIEVSSDDLSAVGGCLAPYAGFPEFGTIKQRANPYWMPFVWANLNEMMENLKKLHMEMFSK